MKTIFSYIGFIIVFACILGILEIIDFNLCISITNSCK